MVVVKRPLRGSRVSSFCPPIPEGGPSLSDLDSAFQLQEYISLLIQKNPHDVEAIVTLPGRVKKSEPEEKQDADGKNDVAVDEACWIYEQLRRLAQDLTYPLVTSLQQECTRASCPEMKAGEWLYLCVAHGNDGAMEQCCAIDYIIHTLDSATALLNSPRAFPSRISIPQPSIRHFSSLARRLGRIFAHAYFHHREAFESSEAENSLYARFLALTARFDLVPPEFLVIPPRMANLDSSSGAGVGTDAEPPRLLGAALHPQPQTIPAWEPEKERGRNGLTLGSSVMESPRKVGRNRTDTMVFSDAEAFSEALRGQAGSPSSGQEKEVRTGGLGLETSEGIPHVDSLEVIAASPETCRPHTDSEADKEGEKESKPYRLTFSASGTMKTALPPGVSPSSSNAGGPGLAPSPLQPYSLSNHMTNQNTQVVNILGNEWNDGASHFEGLVRGRGFADSVNLEERAPASEGDGEDAGEGEGDGEEESALDTVLSHELSQEELERDEPGDPRLIDLLARKQVLEGRMRKVDLPGDEEWTGRDPSKREEEFVVVSQSTDEPESGEAHESHESEEHDEKPSTALAGDSGLGAEATKAGVSEVSVDCKGNEVSPSALDGTPIDAEEKASKPEGEESVEAADPDTSLEADIADVEKALNE